MCFLPPKPTIALPTLASRFARGGWGGVHWDGARTRGWTPSDTSQKTPKAIIIPR